MGPASYEEPGICVGSCFAKDLFVPWNELRVEVEAYLLPQLAQVPNGSRVEMQDLGDRKNMIVRIVSPSGGEVAHIWFGPDPENEWVFDGFVRVGKATTPTTIWGTFQRYSDSSYRPIVANP